MRGILTILFIVISTALGWAQNVELKSAIAGSGASESQSTNYALRPVIGQAAAGQNASSTFSLRALFLPNPASPDDPTITNFSPTQGSVGTIVTITGTNFGTDVSMVAVLFASTATTNVNLISPTQITCEVPAGISGDVNISVTIGSKTAVSTGLFSVVPVPTITFASDHATSFPDGSASVLLSVDVTHDFNVSDVQIIFRPLRLDDSGIRSTSADPGAVNGSTQNYTYTLNAGDVDELGITYRFEATDVFQNVGSTGQDYLYRIFSEGSEPSVQGFSFGGNPENWRMFSIPYDSETRQISQIFESQYGSYDNTKWRMVRWNASAARFDEYRGGFTTLESGAGYWFNAKESKVISISSAEAPNVRDDLLRTIVLQPGWNQIGNPYPFTMSWSDVLRFNANPADVSSTLRVFSGGTALQDASTLDAWKGAYVENTGGSSVTLDIPFRPVPAVQARMKRTTRSTNPLDATNWALNLDLESGIYSNQITRLGMHPEALDFVRDRFDESRVPRLGGYLDVNFVLENKFLSSSFKTTKDVETWDFTVENNLSNDVVKLSWDNSYFGENVYQLILHDLENEKLVNMRSKSEYSYRNDAEHRFRVYYGSLQDLETEMAPTRAFLTNAFPNPFSSELVILYTIPDSSHPWHVNLSIYNTMGHQIATLSNLDQNSGFHRLEWDTDDLPAGIYFLRMSASDNSASRKTAHFTQRIIKQ